MKSNVDSKYRKWNPGKELRINSNKLQTLKNILKVKALTGKQYQYIVESCIINET